MKEYLLYLAGPIGGTSYHECTEWREEVSRMLPSHIQPISPMRGKEFLKAETCIDANTYTNPLATPLGLTSRDRFDVFRCDAVLFNLLDERISIGSLIEIGWADANRKPMVMVTLPDSQYAKHPMIKMMVPYIVSSLDVGVQIISKVLS